MGDIEKAFLMVHTNEKRNVITTASKIYDPLGMISPVTVQFKILFQELRKDKKY